MYTVIWLHCLTACARSQPLKRRARSGWNWLDLAGLTYAAIYLLHISRLSCESAAERDTGLALGDHHSHHLHPLLNTGTVFTGEKECSDKIRFFHDWRSFIFDQFWIKALRLSQQKYLLFPGIQ